MKTLSLLALATGCTAGSNLGNTPILGAPAWTASFSSNPGFLLPYVDEDASANGGVAFAPDGDLMIAAAFDGTVSFGDGQSYTPNGHSVFISRRSRVDGSQVWTRTISLVTALSRLSAFVVDGAGNSYVAGGTNGDQVDFGSKVVPASEGLAYVAKYSPEGALLWARGYGGASALMASTLTLMPDGNVMVTGTFGLAPETEILPSGKTQACLNNGPCNDWLIELDPDGNPIRDAFMPMRISRVASPGDGTLDVAGVQDVFGPLAPNGAIEITHVPMLMTLAGDGTVLQTSQVPWPQTDYFARALVPTDDGLVMSAGGTDRDAVPYLDKFEPTGALAWTESLTGTANLTGIAPTPDGALVGVGRMRSNTVDFGHGPVSGNTYIATYRADGSFVDARTFGDGTNNTADDSALAAIAVAKDGSVAYAGVVDQHIDFGAGPTEISDQVGSAFVFGLISPPLP